MEMIYLSHLLEETTPAYGNGDSLVREHAKQIAQGDGCNTQVWHLSNHIGTHVDAPRHFCAEGVFLDAYPAAFWACSPVCCVEAGDIAKKEIVTADHLDLDRVPGDVELLLIKTGFVERRDRIEYIMENPGFDPGLAEVLRSRFSRLKMVGFDSISLSSFAARPLGREAHKAFLDHKSPILIIEDMDLSRVGQDTAIQEVIVSPLRVKNSDGGPCTVMARI